MHVEKISEIIAHFIGYFDAASDEARMRMTPTEGSVLGQHMPDDPMAPHILRPFASDLALEDYDPRVDYSEARGLDPRNALPSQTLHLSMPSIHLSDIVPKSPHFPSVKPFDTPPEGEQRLPIYAGPGSSIAHSDQINLLQDDDFLDMTSRYHVQYDMSFVHVQLAEDVAAASRFLPLGEFHRTDSPAEIQKIESDIHSYASGIENGSIVSGSDTGNGFILASSQIEGCYINGELSQDAPVFKDSLPDRGIAQPDEIKPSDVSLVQHGLGPNTLDVAAGANVVGNYAGVVDANLISPVMSVLGSYHQADVINQAFSYCDTDHSGFPGAIQPIGATADVAETTALNIAMFERHSYESAQSNNGPASNAATESIFPTSWHVSVVDGDVSFVRWVEQYNFVSDNDQLTVTSMGCQATAITGANVTTNLASYLGIGLQYDLVIVGGNVYDMNLINQLNVLYDKDWIANENGAPGWDNVTTGGNLLWNEASIVNIGDNSRFQALPDYMTKAAQGIATGDPNMPDGLAHDANFAGQNSLNVLYITGDLYDLNYIKQVSVLGDADMVSRAASEVIGGDVNAVATVDTGHNAVFNLAEIVDYDSFGHTTYVGGGLYSDAVLVQGGLIDSDAVTPQQGTNAIANEVIAFLGDDAVDTSHQQDPNLIISPGDVSWHAASPVDAMQTVVA